MTQILNYLLMPALAAFFIGCVFTEIRWITRLRRLRGQLSLREASREYGAEEHHSIPLAIPQPQYFVRRETAIEPDAMRQSLFNLQQALATATATVPVETPVASKIR